MQFTKNFSYNELTRSSTAKRKGIDNTPGVEDIRNLQALCDTILQPIREKFGKPIIVSSGYRCPKLNKAVGGVKNSDHMYGCAADITPNPNPSPALGKGVDTLSAKEAKRKATKELFDLIVSMIKAGEIEVKQVIDEYDYSWIHISYQGGRTSKRNQILHIR